MAVNLYVYSIVGNFASRLPIEEWDYKHHAGDRTFALSIFSVKTKDIHDKYYWRPVDFELWKKFVKDRVLLDAQKRFLKMLERMEKDKKLHFYTQW